MFGSVDFSGGSNKGAPQGLDMQKPMSSHSPYECQQPYTRPQVSQLHWEWLTWLPSVSPGMPWAYCVLVSAPYPTMLGQRHTHGYV